MGVSLSRRRGARTVVILDLPLIITDGQCDPPGYGILDTPSQLSEVVIVRLAQSKFFPAVSLCAVEVVGVVPRGLGQVLEFEVSVFADQAEGVLDNADGISGQANNFGVLPVAEEDLDRVTFQAVVVDADDVGLGPEPFAIDGIKFTVLPC